jgi:hypothetical protein
MLRLWSLAGYAHGSLIRWAQNTIQRHRPDAVAQKRLLDEAARLAAGWQDMNAEHLRALLLAVVTKVQVHSDRIDMTIDQMGVALWLNARVNGNLLTPADMIENDI